MKKFKLNAVLASVLSLAVVCSGSVCASGKGKGEAVSQKLSQESKPAARKSLRDSSLEYFMSKNKKFCKFLDLMLPKCVNVDIPDFPKTAKEFIERTMFNCGSEAFLNRLDYGVSDRRISNLHSIIPIAVDLAKMSPYKSINENMKEFLDENGSKLKKELNKLAELYPQEKFPTTVEEFINIAYGKDSVYFMRELVSKLYNASIKSESDK